MNACLRRSANQLEIDLSGEWRSGKRPRASHVRAAQAVLLWCGLFLTGCAASGQGVVAVLTDYGTRDHYVGIISGAVLKANPRARIATLTHETPAFDIADGAWLLNEIGPELPAGAVLLAIVDPGVGTARAPIAARTRSGLLLVGPDNGLFDPLITTSGGAEVYRIQNFVRTSEHSSTFHGRDLFAPIAGYLSAGGAIERIGPRMESWTRLDSPPAAREADGLRGAVAHVDVYGNVLTNIPADWLDSPPYGATLRVQIGDRVERVAWRKTYGDVTPGEMLALRNASERIELAVNQGSAAERLAPAGRARLRAGTAVRIARERE